MCFLPIGRILKIVCESVSQCMWTWMFESSAYLGRSEVWLKMFISFLLKYALPLSGQSIQLYIQEIFCVCILIGCNMLTLWWSEWSQDSIFQPPSLLHSTFFNCQTSTRILLNQNSYSKIIFLCMHNFMETLCFTDPSDFDSDPIPPSRCTWKINSTIRVLSVYKYIWRLTNKKVMLI